MKPELEAIRKAWDPGDPETKNVEAKRDENKTRRLADKYVQDHPGEFEELANLSEPDCVKALEVFRSAGLEDSEWRVQVWLFHAFEPQNIGGEHHSVLRVPNAKSEDA